MKAIRSMASVCSLSLIFFGISALAGTQADYAIQAVQKLKEQGKIKEGAKIRLMAKVGLVRNFWGPDLALKNEWESKTGIPLVVDTYPNEPVLEILKAKPQVDLIMARTGEYPDLVHQNLISDLTPFFKAHQMDFTTPEQSGFLAWRQHTMFDGKYVAIPADCDFAIMYIRTDLIDSPENQKKFKDKYSIPLQIPKSWDEYEKHLEFFHDPKNEFYGTVEQRDIEEGWMFWFVRYASMKDPVQYFFDEEMNPLLNTPEGVQATESYLRTLKYSAPDILKPGNDANYSLPLYVGGKAYSYILTPVVAKLLNRKGGKLAGKWSAIAMPGTKKSSDLISHTSIIYGNNFVVPQWSENKELAYLYAMFFTDPDVSAQGVAVTSGHADPFRTAHYSDPLLQKIYSKEFLDTVRHWTSKAIPNGTGLPGNSEYIKKLSTNLYAAAKGELTAKQAMQKTEKEWNVITKKYGKAQQIKYLKAFKKTFAFDGH